MLALSGHLMQLERKLLLDSQECERTIACLLSLRHQWTQRNNLAPFFTLGAASYLDAQPSSQAYRQMAETFNPLLQDQFGWLLQRVSAAISGEFGLRTEWLPQAALPGFHIFLAHWAFSLPVASIHFDMQHYEIDWTGVPEADFSVPLSFTLPIQLPKWGGGLHTWNFENDHLSDSAAIQEKARSTRPTFHEYRLGELVMHSGNMLHQIAPTPRMEPDDRRVTLQGHGIKANGRIYLYW